jgi:CRISPR/Cas system-associated exonuclease Cas4 (RecB family)
MSDPVEHHAVENVIARLTERFPTLARDRVQQVVDEELARLEAGRVREYIPALVEHAADERLRGEADPVSVAAGDPGGPAVVADDAAEMDPMEIERTAREQRAGFLFGDLGGGSV